MADFELDTEYTFNCRFEVNTVACVWGDIDGDINDQTDLKDALDSKADAETVNGIDERLGTVENTIEGYGDIVTHDVDEFATAAQGALADTAVQPADLANYVPTSRTVNNKALSSDISLNYSDVGALSDTTTINDLTTTAQQDALNSGATTTNIGQITTNKNDIITINGKIPSDATTTNQLADKNFVNSSISTNTANFIGTFNSVAELEAYSGTLTNNDYAFVIGIDSDGNTVYNRYKYSDDAFNRNAFTVVGTPTITDDRIASGFSSSNYLKILNSIFSNIGNKSWKIEWSGNLSGKTGHPYPKVLGDNHESTNSFINCGHFNNTDNWFFNVVVNDNGTPTLSPNVYISLPTSDINKPYFCYIEYTGTKYIMGLKTYSMSSFSTKEIENSNPIMPQSNDLALGHAMSTGSLDLKQFSITVNGQEVFSGSGAWLFEYALNNSSFTANQWASINSGANTTNIGQISTNTNDISNINTTIGGYGDIVTHDASEFASAQQGSLADTSLQPNDNISELVNDVGYTANVGTVTSVNNNLPDANGDVSLYIPPAQVQSDWNENDTISASYIKNKPYIPVGVVVDQNYNPTSQNAQSGTAVAEAIATVDISDDVKHALKCYNDNGQLLTDTTLYNYISSQYYSNFDTTKYTVDGSPTILGNGLFSGFTGSNGIKYTINYAGNNYNTFELYLGEYELTTIDANQWFYKNGKTENGIQSGFLIHFNNSNKLRFFAGSGVSNYDIFGGQVGSVTHAQNAKVRVKLVFDGANYTLYSSDNGGAWVQEYTKATTLKILFPNEIIIGRDQNYFRGKADLKTLQTIFDNQIVFSANKTGILNYPAVHSYTVNGTLTNTNEIYSGTWSSTNNITIANTIDFTKSWKIQGKITAENLISGIQQYIFCFNGIGSLTNGLWLVVSTVDDEIVYLLRLGANSYNTLSTTNIKWNTVYFEAIYDAVTTKYTLNIKEHATDNWTSYISGVTSSIMQSNGVILIGAASYRYFAGSIDMKEFGYSNNEIPIQYPSFSITYNIGNSGIFIANFGSRENIKNATAISGNCNIFSIDITNQNVTLPMANIYGLMSNKIPDYSNTAITIATTPYTVGAGGHYLLFESAVDSATVSINGLQVASVSGTGTFSGSIYSIRMGDTITYTGSPVLKILGERSA